MTVHWNRRTYSKEEFSEAWLKSRSIAECIRELGLSKYGDTYNSVKAAAEDLGLDDSHMLGQGWNVGLKGHKPFVKIPLEDILVENSTYTNSSALKKRLWKEGALEKECSECGIHEWRGQPAPLALDHVNGNNRDNRIDNLRILCYNCHGQTDTWCSKNRKP